VAVFNYPLSFEQISTIHYVLYNGAIPLTSSLSGTTLTLNWAQGTLLSASSLAGPWTPVAGASPPSYEVTTSGSQMYFRLGL
jgi:hypothetical protein